MSKLFWTELLLSLHMAANQLIYFLQHLPIVGRLFKDRLYAAYDGKVIIGVVSLVLNAILKLLLSLLYLVIMIGGPIFFLLDGGEIVVENLSIPSIIYYIFFWTSFIFGSFINTALLENSGNEYMLLQVLHVEPRRHYRMVLVQKMVLELITFMPLAFFIGFLPYLGMYVALQGYRMAGEFFYVYMYERCRYKKAEHWLINVAALLLTLGAGYGGFFLGVGEVPDYSFIIHPLHILISAGIGILCFMYLFRFPGYRRLSKELVLRESIAFENDLDAMNSNKVDTKSLSLNEKHLDLTKGSRAAEKKKGYAYLNTLFFERHQKVNYRLVILKSALAGGFTLGVAFILIIVPGIREVFYERAIQVSPGLVFVMYLLSSGKSVCRTLFFNCDRMLLKYGYYRKGRAVLENFSLRIGRVLLMDLIPAGILCLLPLTIMLLTGHTADWPLFALIISSILFLSVFFSVFHVFAYYICQPYTEEMVEQSALFRVLNALVYVVSYMTVSISSAEEEEFSLVFLMNFNVAILIITLLFITVSFILIYRLAPKRFRLR